MYFILVRTNIYSLSSSKSWKDGWRRRRIDFLPSCGSEIVQDDYEQQSKNYDIDDAHFDEELEFKERGKEEATKTVHHKEKFDKETAKNI